MLKKILLIDGNALLFRAFYSSQGRVLLTTKNGTPTNAIYSFINMIFNIMKKNDYFDIKVAFDKGKKTFRHEKLTSYKAGRKKTPKELIDQFPIAREFLSSAQIDWFEIEGYEADDIIGTISDKYKNNSEYEIHILSNDQDMYQLIADNIFVISPQTGTSDILVYDKQKLYEKWGITPEQVIDYKGLRGDSSDNIKGVNGIGEIGAKELLKEYKNLENIYQNIDEISLTKKQKLIEGKDDAFLSREISTIILNVPILSFSMQKLEINFIELKSFFSKYEMVSFIKKYISQDLQNRDVKAAPNYQVITRWKPEFNDEVNYVYLETLEQNYHRPDLIGMGIINSKGNFIYFFDIMDGKTIFNWRDEIIDKEFQKFLLTKEFKTYDIKKTIFCLRYAGYQINEENFIYDMMIAAYVLNSNVKSNFESHVHAIDSSIEINTFEEVFGKGVKKTKQINNGIKSDYLISHALIIKTLEEKILQQLKESEQFVLYNQIELPLSFVLLSMEQEGIFIDKDELRSQTQHILELLTTTEKNATQTIKNMGFEEINFASPKQLKELLFDKLKLPTNKKGSTDREVLEGLVDTHPIINEILMIRKYQKLYTTYLKGFEKYIFANNKVHTIYNQTLTNTGRLSSQDPNLQNISIRDDEQKKVRKIFITKPGDSFLSFDYSQIELRVLADYVDETALISAFNNNIDIHELAARKIFNLSNDQKISAEQRRVAKVFNFGILYGLTKFGLAKDLKISHNEAQNYIDAYNKTFPKIELYKEEIINFAISNGYVKMISNRRRYIYELQSKEHMVKEFGKRAAINAPIQGTAADIIKVAMVNVYKKLKEINSSAKIVAQVHDELILTVKTSEIDKIKKIVEEIMNDSYNQLLEISNKNRKAKVPLEVKGSFGDSWYNLK